MGPEYFTPDNKAPGRMNGSQGNVAYGEEWVRRTAFDEETDKLRTALAELVKRLHEIEQTRSYHGIFQLAAMHGLGYDGPQWTEPLAKAEAALK